MTTVSRLAEDGTPVVSRSMTLRRERAITGDTGLLPLALVSAMAVSFEIALTRYFAVAKWSEYGYWIISIVMVGFALSGVAVALMRPLVLRQAGRLRAALPACLIAAASAGFWAVTINPFNPLQLQNPATYAPQLWNIGLYYLALLPFFFAAGLFVSLTFLINPRVIGRVYAWDLAGAGAGAALVLALLWAVHPFFLVACLLPLGWLAALATGVGRGRAVGLASAALLAGGGLLILDNRAATNEYKAIYAPSHTEGARVLAQFDTPRGIYTLLDDFTERVDTDVSNDSAMLGFPGPPRAYGLYRDGNRIAALPRPRGLLAGYAGGALDSLPYRLLDKPRTLLIGASGGFRIAEALSLGARSLRVIEADPLVRAALRGGLAGSPGKDWGDAVSLGGGSPLAAAATGGYDLVDLSADFADEAEANGVALSAEALAAYLRAVGPGGLVSVPVSIRDFPVYAMRALATARRALVLAGIADPAGHVVVYRSAWSVRILLSPETWDAARVQAIRDWAGERSFDVSYYPGIDLAASRAGIYNDLPAVSFEQGEVLSGSGLDDAVADEAFAVLTGARSASSAAFDLAPMTLDRPFVYDVLRLDRLGTILKRLEILPQQEIGLLVNVAVLAQAVLLAALVLLVPLVAGRRVAARAGLLVRASLYFASLGLGFLFIEITLIEKASLFLSDRTSAFAIVLTGMLIFSGLGSLISGRIGARGQLPALLCILAWGGLAYAFLTPAILATLSWPWAARAALVLLATAPGSVALGMPFPLGLAALPGEGGLLPWAWALNGAFSVVATPLANLIAVRFGFGNVLLSALLLYAIAYIARPIAGRNAACPSLASPPAADA